jgi:Fur family ferric uptake transcriptional regulator
MHYEPIYGQGHHCHLRCLGCGKVVEFFEKDMKKLEERLAKKTKFKIQDHRLDVIGYCPDCQKKMDRDERIRNRS